MWRTPRDAPLLLVDLAALVRVEEVQGLLEARRMEQEHQVVVAAIADKLDHLGVILYGGNDLLNAERAAAVLVDELEAALGGGKELARELGDLLQCGLALRLAGRGALLELVRERLLDTFLPARNVEQ